MNIGVWIAIIAGVLISIGIFSKKEEIDNFQVVGVR